MQVTFCGAARQVTGSCFLFEVGPTRFLVDCGLFQGGHGAQERNRAPFAFDPRELAFVALTHAHLDHSGLLPRLAAAGFAGPVYATEATKDLIAILLRDSAHLQQMEAERATRHGRRETAIYDAEDVLDMLRQVRTVPYDQSFEPAPGVSIVLRDAGHILGSAIVELWLSEGGRTRKVVVSGDLGQPGRPIVRDPAIIRQADVLLLESTYGDRDHRSLERTLDELVDSLHEALFVHSGIVLVPAFAVGRTQELLYFMNRLCQEGRLGNLNVFVDSPMATEVTAVTARHIELFNDKARQMLRRAPNAPGPLSHLKLKFTGSVDESKALNRLESGAIIIASSGMCDGGRIRHHLKHRLSNPHTTVLIVGFQAAGTLGRRLVDGAKSVNLFGEDIPVHARIVTLGGFSAHADQSALLGWLGHLDSPPANLFLVHGEERGCEALALRIREQLGWRAQTPVEGETSQL